MPTEDAAHLLDRIAANIKRRRRQLGWTQDEFGARIGLAVQNVQRLESGRDNPTVTRLHRIASALGVTVGDLLSVTPPGEDAPAAAPPRARIALADLSRFGWRTGRLARGLPVPAGAVPVYDLRAVAGRLANDASVAATAWAEPPAGRHFSTHGVFLARVQGDSMEPLATDGAWCLFRAPVAPPWLGRVVLVRVSDAGTPDDGGAFLLKRVGAVEAPESGGLRLRLDSANRAHAPLFISARSEDELQVVAELVEVLKR